MQPYHTTCKWYNYVLVCIAAIFTTIFKCILIRAGSFIVFSRPITLQHEIKSVDTGLHIPRYVPLSNLTGYTFLFQVPLSNLAGYTFHCRFHLPFSSSTFHFRWVTFAYGRLHYPVARQIKKVIIRLLLHRIIIIIIIRLSRRGIMVYNLSAFLSYYDFLLVGILYLPIFVYIILFM